MHKICKASRHLVQVFLNKSDKSINALRDSSLALTDFFDPAAYRIESGRFFNPAA